MMLPISEREIRRHGSGNGLLACWRQWRAERALARRGIHFRATDPDTSAAAYAAMSDQEFDAINARQDWANWRTIPRAISGHVPDRPLRILDLGTGTGSSTRVLAFYCPVGSQIIGYELVPPLMDCARRRQYLHRSGQPVPVAFVCQGVTEPLRMENGQLVPEHTIDLVNASGVVGHHLNVASVPILIEELRRVLIPGGLAMLDVGPALSAQDLLPFMKAAGFQALRHSRSWCCDPTGEIVFRQQANLMVS